MDVDTVGLMDRRAYSAALDIRKHQSKTSDLTLSCSLFAPKFQGGSVHQSVAAALSVLQKAGLFGAHSGGAGLGGAANVNAPGALSPGPAGLYTAPGSNPTRQPFSPGPSGVFGAAPAVRKPPAAPVALTDPVFCFDDSGNSGSTHDAEGFDKSGFNRKGVNRAGYDRSGVRPAMDGTRCAGGPMPQPAKTPGNATAGSGGGGSGGEKQTES